MNFNEHSITDAHALLSPSYYHWLNYNDDQIINRMAVMYESARGTRLHSIAQQLITEKITLPDNNQTLNRYVNDAIRFRMVPEQLLYYSNNCFGTADTIRFNRNLLRVHDLKTGKTRVSMQQLKIYAGLFCLEYGFKPSKIRMELRIYKDDDIITDNPEVDEIVHVMDRIIHFDKVINEARESGMV